MKDEPKEASAGAEPDKAAAKAEAAPAGREGTV